MYTKYEVSMFNPVPGGRCAQTTPTPMQDDDANDDRQSMTVYGSLVDKPNELKTIGIIFFVTSMHRA